MAAGYCRVWSCFIFVCVLFVGTAVCPEEATAISSPTSLDIQTATLLGEFPDCDYDAMRDILIQTNGDLDLARTLLT